VLGGPGRMAPEPVGCGFSRGAMAFGRGSMRWSRGAMAFGRGSMRWSREGWRPSRHGLNRTDEMMVSFLET
jgi:hypothetical protein